MKTSIVISIALVAVAMSGCGKQGAEPAAEPQASAAIEDPVVTLNFVVSSGGGASFTVTSAALSFPVLPTASARATAALTVTDFDGGGASLTGGFDGGNAYRAFYNSAEAPPIPADVTSSNGSPAPAACCGCPANACSKCAVSPHRCARYSPKAPIAKSTSPLPRPGGTWTAPGGGSVASLAGSLGASLATMVANLTTRKKAYRDVKEEMYGIDIVIPDIAYLRADEEAPPADDHVQEETRAVARDVA